MSDVVSGVRDGISIIGNAAIKAGEAAAIAAYPWLGLPVIKQIWESILGHFLDAVILTMQDSSTRILIPIIDQAQADAANQATEKLKKDLEDVRADSLQTQRDLDEVKKAYADLIHMRTST